MPKRCPNCKKLNSGAAVRCVNPACDYRFGPDPPVKPPDSSLDSTDSPPAIQPPPMVADHVVTPQPLRGPQVQPTQPDHEVVELRNLVDRLYKELAEQQQKFERFVTEQQPSAIAERSPAPPGNTRGSIATVLGVAAQWPKVTALGTAVLALVSGYGGVTSCRDVELPADGGGSPAAAAVLATTSVPAVDPAPPKVPVMAQQEQTTDVDERERKVSDRESNVSTRELHVTAGETQLAAKARSLTAREEAMAAEDRVAVAGPPRMGSFDFTVPKGRGRVELVEGDVRGAWPSRDCAIVAVTPFDVDEVPKSFPSSCTKDGITLDKPKGVPDGRRVRVVWQLNETAGRR